MIFEEKTLESEIIYKGAILNLRKDKVTVKNGTSYREIIEHNGGSCAVAITKENKIVMVKQFRKPLDDVVLEIPAGKIEKGEDHKETIIRELREETGYTGQNIKFLSKFYPSVGYTTEALYIYLATDLIPGETDFDENEAIDIVEIDFDEAVRMVYDGRITDGKSVIGILMAKGVMNVQR